MKRSIALFVTVLLVGVTPAFAAPILFGATLSGPNESPSNASPGTGVALVTIDPVAQTMIVDVTFQGLLANTMASHIHVINGPGDANTADTLGPVTTTTPTFPGFPLGVTSGTYFNVFDMTLASSYNPAFVTAAGSLPLAEAALFDGIISGRAYLNIHSTQFPGGEIRGFLTPVPEPASLVLLASGGAGFIANRLRQRRRRS
jgi:hypothetical protein